MFQDNESITQLLAEEIGNHILAFRNQQGSNCLNRIASSSEEKVDRLHSNSLPYMSPRKILVVDDELDLEPLVKQRFRKNILAGEFDFLFAHDGLEALEILGKDKDIVLVLTDINMPNMDGLTLLDKLRKINPCLKAVVISAYSDLSHIRALMNRGAIDFLIKPIDFKDLLATLRKSLKIVQEMRDSQQNFQQIQVQLIQNEKMSVLANLLTGVAHEMNNALGLIIGNLKLTSEVVKDVLIIIDLYRQKYPDSDDRISKKVKEFHLKVLDKELNSLFSSIEKNTKFICDMSDRLQIFNQSDLDLKNLFDVHEGINNILLFLRHRLKETQTHLAIEVIKDYGNLPKIECYPKALHQALHQILVSLINSIEAANKKLGYANARVVKSRIFIQTSVLDEHYILLKIQDDGVALSETIKTEVLNNLFVPQPGNRGMEMGLELAHQIIVEKHKGNLEVYSTPGKGIHFLIKLPINFKNFA